MTEKITGAEMPEASPTAGMNIAQRILHVGGRNNAAGYVEFGSIQAVEALVRQVLRDLPAAPQQGETAGAVYAELPEPALSSTQCDSTMRYTTLRSFSERQMREFADATCALRAAAPHAAAASGAPQAGMSEARWADYINDLRIRANEGDAEAGTRYDEYMAVKTPQAGAESYPPSDAMVDAYLQAQRHAVEEADRFGRPNIGGLHTNTVREACRAGLAAALRARGAVPQAQQPGAAEGDRDE